MSKTKDRIVVSPEAFTAWRETRFATAKAAAKRMGLCAHTVRKYQVKGAPQRVLDQMKIIDREIIALIENNHVKGGL